MTTTINYRFKYHRDIAANWTSVNPILLEGEPGWEKDTGKKKTGDGVTAWNSLPYDPGQLSDAELLELVRDMLATALVAGANITITPNDGSDTITIAVSGLGTMAAQNATAVNITGGTIAGLTALSMSQSASGAGTTGLIITRTDSTAGVGHTSRFLTQQQGAGVGRSLFQAASPTTGNTRGQFDILNEAGTVNILRLGFAATAADNTADFYDIAGTLKARINTTGASYLNGGNVGINEASPDYKLDVNGTFGFTPGNSVTPVDNGDVVFELTNNTTLTIRARGSDGTVRSGTIVLA